MRKVKIITDSTNDLTREMLDSYGVTIVPLYVDFGEESYKDGVDLIPERLFELVEEKNILPKTAAPSPYDFIGYYRQYLDSGYDIIVITISSKISATYQNALLAMQEFPKDRIWVIDSQNLSTGIGLLVMLAGEYAREGKSAGEIAEKLQEIIPRVRVSFIVDTLEYLYKGGRCNALQNMVGSVLKIRPVIGVRDGRIIVQDKVRGDKKKALQKILDGVEEAKETIDFDRIFITYSLGGEEEAAYLKDCLEKSLPPACKIFLTQAGCVISSHCGKKTVGTIYVEK